MRYESSTKNKKWAKSLTFHKADGARKSQNAHLVQNRVKTKCKNYLT